MSANSALFVRRNNSFLADVEGRVLGILIARTPQWISPDFMTVVGLAGGLLCFLGYVLSNFSPGYLVVAEIGILLNWLGDSLDGGLARFREIERPKYGHFTDQSVDVISIGMALLGLGLSPWVRLDVALAGFSTYLMIALQCQLRAAVTGIYDISLGKIGGTEMRLLIFLCTLIMLAFPAVQQPLLGGLGAIDLVLVVTAASCAMICIGVSVAMMFKLRSSEDSCNR